MKLKRIARFLLIGCFVCSVIGCNNSTDPESVRSQNDSVASSPLGLRGNKAERLFKSIRTASVDSFLTEITRIGSIKLTTSGGYAIQDVDSSAIYVYSKYLRLLYVLSDNFGAISDFDVLEDGSIVVADPVNRQLKLFSHLGTLSVASSLEIIPGHIALFENGIFVVDITAESPARLYNFQLELVGRVPAINTDSLNISPLKPAVVDGADGTVIFVHADGYIGRYENGKIHHLGNDRDVSGFSLEVRTGFPNRLINVDSKYIYIRSLPQFNNRSFIDVFSIDTGIYQFTFQPLYAECGPRLIVSNLMVSACFSGKIYLSKIKFSDE